MMHAASILARFAKARSGAAAVEFVLMAPILVFVMVAMVDFGRAIYLKSSIESVVSAGANYALVNGSLVTATNAGTLSGNVAVLLSGNSSASPVSGKVVVNNGSTATLSSGTIVKTGTASNADSCYCPTISGTAVTWGIATACGSACAGGALAGKFVEVRAQRTYAPIFSGYGIALNNTVSARAMVQTQ